MLKRFFKINDAQYIDTISKAGTIGLHMVSCLIVGTAIGYFLDLQFGTDPWCLLIFLIAGVIAGFKNVYVDTKQLVDSQQKEDQAQADKHNKTKTP